MPHDSLSDKTEVRATNANGQTEIVPIFVNETRNDGEVHKEDVFYCFPPKLDNDIIKALNVLCHYKKFENYSQISSEPLEASKCWDIKGCQDCGFDNVDNIQSFLTPVTQASLKLVVKCDSKIDENKAETVKGYQRLSTPPVKNLNCDDSLLSLKKDDE